MRTSHSSLLTQLSTEAESLFRCPNESQPVSRAIHLGRLASGYADCQRCAWRFEADDDAQKQAPPSSAKPRADAPKSHTTAIFRTRDGVRGQYINAIDRNTASQLATILASHLRTLQPDVNSPLIIGYTGHRGTPDLLAGVVSSVLRCGWSILDAGRSTSASLHHGLRSTPDASYGLLISGNRRVNAEVALDIITPDGQPLAIPWSDYGVSSSTTSMLATELQTSLRASDSSPILNLPASGLHRSQRAGRSSGTLTPLSLEPNYREWLTSWWPDCCATPILVRCSEDNVYDRLNELSQVIDGRLSIQWTSDLLLPVDAHRSVRIDIHEDDRCLTVFSASGTRLSADALCRWINTSQRSNVLHVTAHISPDGRSLQLYDAASPTSGHAQNVICDGLAIAGLITSLSEQNQLPK